MSVDVDTLLTGYPGISKSNGGLSWSTVGLVKTGDRVVVVDTGPMGARTKLRQRLGDRGLDFGDVTDVVITHLHHDHSINWPLFGQATIHVSRRELDWALALTPGVEPAPEFYAAALASRPGVHLLDDTDDVLPGIRSELVPGHTPGSIIVRVDAGDHEVIFAGDAAKNRAELMSLRVQASGEAAASLSSLRVILDRWREDPRTVLIPGHDLPLRFVDGRCETIGERPNSLQARLGDDFDDVTDFRLG